MPNIAVFMEQRDGEIKKVAWQMISKARELVDQAGGEVWGVFLGEGDPAAAAGRYGAHRVFTAGGEKLAAYNCELWTAALSALLEQQQPDLLLLGATTMGKELAPRLAARRGLACISDSVELTWDGGWTVRRPILAGKCYTDVVPQTTPAVVGIRPNAFAPAEHDGTAAVETFAPGLDGVTPKAVVKEVRKSEQKTVELTEAEVIVSGGRGLKEAENYKLIEDLAGALGAAAGASRAIVDAGWVDHSHQVGQTGKTVSPNCYIAVGISGAIQHLAGMSSSKCIVAVNKDPNAPIFKAADYGIVADLFHVVPPMIEAVRELD